MKGKRTKGCPPEPPSIAETLRNHAKELERFYYQCKRALPEGGLVAREPKEFRECMWGREWTLRYRDGYAIPHHTGLELELVVRDLQRDRIVISLRDISALEKFFEGNELTNDETASLCNFVYQSLLTIKGEVEDRFNELLATLPQQVRDIAEEIFRTEFNLEEFNLGNPEGREKLKVLRHEMFLRGVISNLEEKHTRLEARLRALQRIIEEEARSLYNTRTFLSGSKTIQGIRERLMNAISKEALGEDSIYSDHEPPADLMPASRRLPPDIKVLRKLRVRTPGENSK